MDHRLATRIGVRTHGREEVELVLLALEEGMTKAEAARLAGVGRDSMRRWSQDRLSHSFTGEDGRGGKIAPKDTQAAWEGVPMGEKTGLYEPPASGPLAGLAPDQIENLLLRAVLADLKAGGWDPASTSNASKYELGERLGRETGLPLRSITAFLRISKSSYEHHRGPAGPRPRRRAPAARPRGLRGRKGLLRLPQGARRAAPPRHARLREGREADHGREGPGGPPPQAQTLQLLRGRGGARLRPPNLLLLDAARDPHEFRAPRRAGSSAPTPAR